MKRKYIALVAGLLVSLQLTPAAFAADSVNARANYFTKQVIIEGTAQIHEQVTVYVSNPSGGIDYIDQTAADSAGHFQFSYTSRSGMGVFKVSVGGTGSIAPLTTSFAIQPPDSSSGSTHPSTSGTGSAANNVPSAPAGSLSSATRLDYNSAVVTKERGADGTEVTKLAVQAELLSAALTGAREQSRTGNPVVTIEANDAAAVQVQLSASVLADAAKAAPDTIITIKGQTSSYDLPLKALDILALQQTFGADSNNMTINVSMQLVAGMLASDITSASNQAGTKLVSPLIEFTVTAEVGDKKQVISSFNSYVSRSIDLPAPVDSATPTGVMFHPASGEPQFVPTVFETVDGKARANMKRKGNSAYGVVSYNKTFDDTAGHWAKTDIELLASKLVVAGVTDKSFAPDQKVTRAEFAALLTRALGLMENGSAAKFSDVQPGEWYAGAIGAAVQAGLVTGFDNNVFKPNDSITREQMAVMMAAAVKQAGKLSETSGKQDALLATFKDKADISGWAQDAVAQSLETGIVQGMTESSFMPGRSATRAQAVVMLKRMLQYVQFIN